MGCCNGRKVRAAEEFVLDTIEQMKISSMSFSEVKSTLKEMITIKSIITKKDFMLGVKHISYANYYEVKVYNQISSNLSDKFKESELLFYLFPFINFSIREDPLKLLYEIFSQINDGAPLSVATLSKYLVDYISFFTSHMNNIIINKIKKEHEDFISDLEFLKDKVYSSSNINKEVRYILEDKGEEDLINLNEFVSLDFRVNICNFKEMRVSFCSLYDASA